MNTFEQLHNIVNEYFKDYHFDKNPVNLYQPIDYILSLGGKRIRPILTLMACELFSRDYKNALEAAVGLEVFHNFTLLHDDIMDKAVLRRGVSTVHEKWNENIALLSGDAMSIIAYQHMSKIPNKMKECLDVFSDTALKICEGQQIDMDFENMSKVCVEDYLKMIELKTAVLIAASLKIGALIGNANETEAENMYQIGLNLGMAFQLQDDLLDVYGQKQVFGKTIGGDIVANKKTFLLINAINLADDKTSLLLDFWLKSTNFKSTEKVEAITSMYNRLQIKEITLQKISNYFDVCKKLYQAINQPEERKIVFMQLIENLESRNY